MFEERLTLRPQGIKKSVPDILETAYLEAIK